MGKLFTRCRISMKFGTRVCLKPSNDRGEFELDRTRSKNNITENSVALGHETHNRLKQIAYFYCTLGPHPLLVEGGGRCHLTRDGSG